MRVTALGVNSAFGTGHFDNVLPQKEAKRILSNAFKEIQIKGSDAQLSKYLEDINLETERAYFPRWQSNFLLEFDIPGKVNKDVFRMVIDCGGDIRHTLAAQGLTMDQIDAWYISHPHSDHIGGIEGVALSTLFNPGYTQEKRDLLNNVPIANWVCEHESLPANCKPDILGHSTVLEEVWEAANPGLRTLQGVEMVKMDTYFNPINMKSNKNYTIRDGNDVWTYYTVVTTHVVAGRDLMPSYGLMFENGDTRIFFPTDTQLFMPPQVKYFYDRASVVYMDCETGFASGVHPHITELTKLPEDMRRKMWLYHYDEKPEYETGVFGGTMEAGLSHDYTENKVSALK